MCRMTSSTNQPSLNQFPLPGYPEFSLGLQSHIRILRLLAYGFLMLGGLLITSAVVYECLQHSF